MLLCYFLTLHGHVYQLDCVYMRSLAIVGGVVTSAAVEQSKQPGPEQKKVQQTELLTAGVIKIYTPRASRGPHIT